MKVCRAALSSFALATLVSIPAFAGADKIVFPENWDKGVLYGTVDRFDIKQFRELYATQPAVEAVKAGKPIPSGTVLTLVQYKAKLRRWLAPTRPAAADS